MLAINLTAGDWDCRAGSNFVQATSNLPTTFSLGFSTATGILDVLDGSSIRILATFASGGNQSYSAGVKRIFQSSQTLNYFNFRETFSGGASNPVVSGTMTCRRVQ